jgi:pimeloyl-ACP methyl ester carboxylesterase
VRLNTSTPALELLVEALFDEFLRPPQVRRQLWGVGGVMKGRFIFVPLLVLITICIFYLAADYVASLETYTDRTLAEPVKQPFAIVFVSGFREDGGNTWTATKEDGSETSWPQMVADDPAYREFDVYSFDFRTTLSQGSPTIASLASDLLRKLHDAENNGTHQKYLFVAHSLGGLVVRKMLIDEPAMRDKTSGLFLIASPLEGASIATLGSWLFQSATLRELHDKNSPTLAAIRDAWASGFDDLAVMCISETLPTIPPLIDRTGLELRWGPTIVSQASAYSNCTQTDQINFADHYEAAQPGAFRTPRRVKLESLLANWVRARDLQEPVDVLIARCEPDEYKDQDYEILRTALAVEQITSEFSPMLGDDWDENSWGLLLKLGTPRVILFHLSCFRERTEGSTSAQRDTERQEDFEKFAAEFVRQRPVVNEAPSRLMVISRAIASTGHNRSGFVAYAFKNQGAVGASLVSDNLLSVVELVSNETLEGADTTHIVECVRAALGEQGAICPHQD